MPGKLDLKQLETLIIQAKTPRQKAMYQELLNKAKQQQIRSQDTSFPESEISSQSSSNQEKIEPETVSPQPIFQAIGVISGEVNLSDEGQHTITVANKEYRLLFLSRYNKAFDALKKEVSASENSLQKLTVYPKVIHFPSSDQPHQLAFQLVGFQRPHTNEGIFQGLNDMEFKLGGLWQFIPVCRLPCVSIMRNDTPKLQKYIEQIDCARKVRVLKPYHLPLLWKDAPVKPFRFNPKAGKDQGYPSFVQVKARFIPHRDVFSFIELLGAPSQKAPRFLKASKKDKAQAKKPPTKEKGTRYKESSIQPQTGQSK